MIERYTIKFSPAVSQKELEKKLNEATSTEQLKDLHKMKARVELVGDPEDIKMILDLLKGRTKQ